MYGLSFKAIVIILVLVVAFVCQALFLLTHLAPLPQGYIRTPVGEVLSEDIIDLIHLPAMTLSWVQKKFDFTNLLIAELGMYHTRAQTRLDAMKGSGGECDCVCLLYFNVAYVFPAAEAPSDAGVLILADRHPHLRQVSHRLSTLTSTLRASAAQLTSDQLSSLWEQTVTNALCPSEATLMCRFIENALPTVAFQTSTEWPLSVTLSREAALVVMQPLVPTAAANPSTSIPALFSTFAHVFKVVNLINGDLKVAADDSAVMFSPAKGNVLGASPPHGQLERSAPQPTAVTVTRPSLLGLPQLWTVALTAVCDEVTVAASLWLVHCHVFVEGSSSIRSTLRQSFIDTCMAEMGSSTPHSPNRVQRVLNLLSLFVTQSESVVALDQNQSRLSPAVKRLGDTFARSGPPTPSRSPLPTSKRPPALTRQGSRDTDDFIEDDRHSPSDRISSSVGDTAADDPSMLDGAPAVIRGHIVIRCTILDPELPPSATLVEISHDASVGELRQVCARVYVDWSTLS